VCAIDLAKAFDKVNHKSSFMKLMKWLIPLELLELLENWLYESYACVKAWLGYTWVNAGHMIRYNIFTCAQKLTKRPA